MIYFDKQHNAYGDLASAEGKEIVYECEDALWNDWQADSDKYIWQNDEIVPNPNYQQILADRREVEFKSKFLELDTNKNFRLLPKGYANAQQSIDTVNNMVMLAGSLTQDIATMVLFYETPDFTKPEECTEEWLLQHQYSAEPMTKEEWQLFYVDFTTKYAHKMYQQQILGV